jgi:hypothetical protein
VVEDTCLADEFIFEGFESIVREAFTVAVYVVVAEYQVEHINFVFGQLSPREIVDLIENGNVHSNSFQKQE